MSSLKKIIILLTLLISILFLVYKEDIPYEGIEILTHYMFGDGSDLHLESSYFLQSPLILKVLKKMKTGETRKVLFRQEEDWRLSYAINGFQITKKANGFSIVQHIKFDTTGKVYTIINTPLGKINFFDNWVHIKKCNPFWVKFDYTQP
jgi:hypothetical protein